jgi:hypothetical protein
MKNVHVHVHGGLSDVLPRVHVGDDEHGIRRDQNGMFATSSGTGEQHAATAEIHASLATRKGTDHPHYAAHMAASEAHKQAATFLAQANKAQHPGAAIEAERHAKSARVHENMINKGRGSDPAGESARQNKAMSDPRVMKGNKERMAELDAKYPQKGAKKAKSSVKDFSMLDAFIKSQSGDCGCSMDKDQDENDLTTVKKFTNAQSALDGDDTVDPATNLPEYKSSPMLKIGKFVNSQSSMDDDMDQEVSGEPGDTMDTLRQFVGDDWSKWNAEHAHEKSVAHRYMATLHSSNAKHYPVGSQAHQHHETAAHHHNTAADEHQEAIAAHSSGRHNEIAMHDRIAKFHAGIANEHAYLPKDHPNASYNNPKAKRFPNAGNIKAASADAIVVLDAFVGDSWAAWNAKHKTRIHMDTLRQFVK